MQKWEYLFAEGYSDSGIYNVNGFKPSVQQTVADFLKEKGAEGWELVAADHLEYSYHLFFKRPISN